MSGFSEVKTLAEIMFKGELLFTSYGSNYHEFYKKLTPNGSIQIGQSFAVEGKTFKVVDIKVEVKENLSSVHPLVQIIHYIVEKV